MNGYRLWLSRKNVRRLFPPPALIPILILMSLAVAGPLAAAPEPPRAGLLEDYGRLPLHFAPNLGQEDPQVKFCARGNGYGLYFTQDGLVLTIIPGGRESTPKIKQTRSFRNQSRPGIAQDPAPTVVRLTPVGMRPEVEVASGDPLPGKVNFFLGNDPGQWRTGIPTYGAVIYREAYSGVDLKFYGRGRALEYDLIVKPGADPGQVRFKYDGVKDLEITPEGDLAVYLPQGSVLLQKKPRVYQEIAGEQVFREGKFRVYRDTAEVSYGFDLAAHDPRYPLIIDPTLVYSTYMGERGDETGEAIAVDALGQAIIVGQTTSLNFPVKNPRQSVRGNGDAFVTKLNAAGNALVYSTYLGGKNEDKALGVAVDVAGNAYVTGFTKSLDFPVLKPFQGLSRGNAEAFVTKLNATGSALIFSTYLGGSSNDFGNAIAVDGATNVYVAGRTSSINFPKARALQKVLRGSADAFVTRLNPLGNTLGYSTFLGGSDLDFAEAIAVNALGQAFVTGTTASIDFPVKGAFQPVNRSIGGTNAFVTKLEKLGRSLIYSTYLGGSGTPAGRGEPSNYVDMAHGIALDPPGNAYVTGETRSINFPTANAFQGVLRGAPDAFVAKLNPQGNGLVYSTFLGGNKEDVGYAIALDINLNAHVTGETGSLDFPLKNPFQGFLINSSAFVSKFSNGGNTLVYSSFLGGSAADLGSGIALDAGGQAYVTGTTSSLDFPTRNPFQPNFGGGNTDVFVTKISK